jgi:hypothetical protein
MGPQLFSYPSCPQEALVPVTCRPVDQRVAARQPLTAERPAHPQQDGHTEEDGNTGLAVPARLCGVTTSCDGGLGIESFRHLAARFLLHSGEDSQQPRARLTHLNFRAYHLRLAGTRRTPLGGVQKI